MPDTQKWIISTALILLAVCLIAISQIILKIQMQKTVEFPEITGEQFFWLIKLFLNPWVILVFVCVFLSGLVWMVALTNVPLSYAYPFTSLTLPLVLFLSYIFLGETLDFSQIVGMLLIISGVIISSIKVTG